MKMVPSSIHKDTSNAELRIFNLLAQEDRLKSYTCYHSLGLWNHSYKNEAEIDFVLLGPNGLFVLEVKGGRVRRDDGIWKFIDRYGRITHKSESPFYQAKTAMYALKDDLSRQFGSIINKYIVGYAVIFPDVEFNESSPEWDVHMVADCGIVDNQFGPWLLKLIDYWGKRHRNRQEIPLDLLEDVGIYLRGDFEAIRPIRMDIKDSEAKVFSLTQEQYRALDAMEDNKRIIFRGSAGTGKTFLAIEKARRNHNRGIKTLFICYNRLVGSFLKREIEKENLDMIRVDSLHHFFYESIIASGHSVKIDNQQQRADLFSDVYPDCFLETLDSTGIYSELIIDEAQDIITHKYIKALNEVIVGGLSQGNWAFFMDAETQRDMFISFDENVYAQLKRVSSSYQLTINCRNTKPIALQAEIISGYPLGQVKKIKGLPVRYAWYKNLFDQALQISECINNLLDEGILAEDIVILSTKRYKESLAGSGRLRLKVGHYQLEKNILTTYKNMIACGTVQSYKGLESSVIILTDIEEINTKSMKTVNYVGYTRARTALWVFLNQKLKKDYEEHFNAIAAIGVSK